MVESMWVDCIINYARCAMAASAKGEAMLESQEHGDGNWSVELANSNWH